MAIWPMTLPQAPLADGYREGFGDNTIRSQMDVGPAKQRRRSTAVEKPCTVPVRLDRAQVVTLRAFYEVTLFGGQDRFTWRDFLTGSLCDYRFRSAPEVGPVNGEPGIWGAVLDLMRQP